MAKNEVPDGMMRLHDHHDANVLSIHTRYRIPCLLLMVSIRDGRITGTRFQEQDASLDYFVDPAAVIKELGGERCQTMHVVFDENGRILRAAVSCDPPSRDFTDTRCAIAVAERAFIEPGLPGLWPRVHSFVSSVCPNDGFLDRAPTKEEAATIMQSRGLSIP